MTTANNAGKDASKAKNKALKKLDLSAIVQHKFADKEYIKKAYDKHQIVLHHTVSGKSTKGDINWWLHDGGRIGTCILIDFEGIIHQVFSSKFWAYHLGETTSTFKRFGLKYKRHDMNSIGIEIDSWGGLVEDKATGNWHPAKYVKGKGFVPNKRVSPIKNVVKYPDKYRGFYGFEKYTDAQIEATRQLLVFWGKHYNISLSYNEDMWVVNPRALSGENGIWSHTSFRLDKSDCHPQKELIDMLKSLTE